MLYPGQYRVLKNIVVQSEFLGFYHFNYVGLESPKTTYGGDEYDAKTNTLILGD